MNARGLSPCLLTCLRHGCIFNPTSVSYVSYIVRPARSPKRIIFHVFIGSFPLRLFGRFPIRASLIGQKFLANHPCPCPSNVRFSFRKTRGPFALRFARLTRFDDCFDLIGLARYRSRAGEEWRVEAVASIRICANLPAKLQRLLVKSAMLARR